MIGFQGSGKTTFAAALWYLVDSRAPQVKTALLKGKHTGNFKYLEAIAAAWEGGWQVGRTGVGTWRPVKINLRSEAFEEEIELSFIDMSGETFEQAFVSREFDQNVEGMARGCDGLLLFVSAARRVDDATLVDIGMAFPEDMPDEDEGDDDDDLADGSESHAAGAVNDREDFASSSQETSYEAATQEAVSGRAPVAPIEFTPADTPRQIR